MLSHHSPFEILPAFTGAAQEVVQAFLFQATCSLMIGVAATFTLTATLCAARLTRKKGR